ncbi:uncharacterized protein PgNI_00977 [Pyricularia grisea]|uniref:Uncharacterized protein n=1 Tax=Pyricularia grisea TaxID=148305 RepID=A0A6P8BI25_PYRGI|nr:uncharacterized protein PgNI_00977 [Pyricularia grisea]TLD16282.1 hypothetical protein PgNI_00977 [Pyricularia grisea]
MSDCRISVWSDPYCQKNKARNSGTAFPAATRQSRYSHTAENHKTGRRETPVPIIPSSFGECYSAGISSLERAVLNLSSPTLNHPLLPGALALQVLGRRTSWTRSATKGIVLHERPAGPALLRLSARDGPPPCCGVTVVGGGGPRRQPQRGSLGVRRANLTEWAARRRVDGRHLPGFRVGEIRVFDESVTAVAAAAVETEESLHVTKNPTGGPKSTRHNEQQQLKTAATTTKPRRLSNPPREGTSRNDRTSRAGTWLATARLTVNPPAEAAEHSVSEKVRVRVWKPLVAGQG